MKVDITYLSGLVIFQHRYTHVGEITRVCPKLNILKVSVFIVFPFLNVMVKCIKD